MGKLFDFATEQNSLRRAWQRIRANGILSAAQETRAAIEMFERDENRNISRIQKLLRSGTFEFEPQKGVLQKKKSGGHRGIVMASVQNRIVERAWLDCLQDKSDLVQKVLNLPTSVGGVPHRSVPHGLQQIRDAFLSGKTFFARSDISGFFDHIPRHLVIERIAKDFDDQKFIDTLRAATTVTLENENVLGEDRRVFPTDQEGVAQGSPLSPLFGNILLYDFDLRFNGRGITCVRFIDDFVLLGDSEGSVAKAFANAREVLREGGLICHDPFGAKSNIEKASHGRVDEGFVFLGYDIRPGLLRPSQPARQKLLSTIDGHFYLGRRAIEDVKKAANSFESRQRYVQTLALVDKVVRGWGEAFAYGNCPATVENLDRAINDQYEKFQHWFRGQVRDQDWKTRRRLGGVGLLGDIKPKSLDEVPFLIERGARFVHTKRTVTVSTDGSVAVATKKRGKDQGPGGWAFVVHDTGLEGKGWEASATNNRMELRAVIEAIRSVDRDRSIIIRTDSQYVCTVAKGDAVVKTNPDLWKEFRELAKDRRIKFVWVKGHNDDVHNERADRLAQEQANLAKALVAKAA